jgi:collectin sub-family protein 10
MRGVSVFVVAAAVAGVVSLAQGDEPPKGGRDPVAAKVAAAVKAYDQAQDRARAAAIEALQKAEKSATKRANLGQVKAARAGIETVKSRGVIPAAAATELQKRQLARARDALASAYAAAAKEYTRAGDVSAAERVLRQRTDLLESRVYVSGPIPADARRFSGRFYKVFPERINWHDARRRCEEEGGHLAIVRDAETNRFLTSLVTEASRRGVWIGATDERVEGAWVWIDGSPMQFSAWAPGQPTNRSSRGEVEHYAALIAAEGGRWNDFPNHGEQGGPPAFVCEW